MTSTAPGSVAAPPAVAVRSSERHGEAVVEDIVYDGVRPAEVEAWLVRPAESPISATQPALLAWHWLDTEAPDGNRDEFLEEARELARRGVVCLLPQGRFPWSIAPSGATADAAEVQREVTRLRRGLDLLAARPDVDPTRLAFVGHDYGAMLGIAAAAEDDRVQALALLAPTPRWGDWNLAFWPIADDRLDYLATMRPLDPVERIAQIGRRPVLLQMANRDFYIPLMAGLELRRAAGPDAAVDLRAYDAEHDLRHTEARADRLAFLETALGRPLGG